MNTEIRCLSPNIIINKSWHVNKVDYSKGWKLVIRGRDAVAIPHPKQAKLTPDELDDCYYLNVNSGEMIPVYLCVPCQKCILCRDKKAVDWATRITCEGNYHVNCPWWLTLTYNDLSLPDDGLVKRDLQNFLKRLRERVSRVVSEDVKLRFVAVGEYGGKTARAHYHLVLFGMPSITAKDILQLIENAWSTRVNKKVFDSLMPDFRFIRHDVNGKPLYYQRLGFAYVKPAHDNTPLYLAKYMFKPEINTPDGKNPNFCLASRKNGIGYQYIVEFRDYHRRNPNVTKLDFKNIHTGKMCHFTIPQYFKDYWFPTPSKIVPPEVKKSYDLFQLLLCRYESLKMLNPETEMLDDVSSMISDLNNKYPFFAHIRPFVNHESNKDYIFLYREKYYDSVVDGFDLCSMSFDEYIKIQRIQLYMEMLVEYEYCMSLKFDVDEFIWTITLRDKYKGSLTQKMANKPAVSPKDVAYKLKKRYEIAKSKQYN